MHKEEHDQACFGESNEQGNNRVEDTKILEGDPGGEPGEEEQGDPDDHINRG